MEFFKKQVQEVKKDFVDDIRSLQKLRARDKSDQDIILKTVNQKINQCEFDVAVVFYKLLSEKYSFKSFKGNVWIDKSNITLSSNDVSSNVRKEITTTLKNAFENYSKKLDVESLQYKSCLKLIEKFNKTSFKNNLIREAREIFFDN